MTVRPGRLPAGVKIVSAILLAIPLLALLIVPIYARTTPRLWGFPFFYWYQLAWVFLAAGFTYAAYLLIRRTRLAGRPE
jgi:Protein of unknown function (DUF3311)